MALVDSPRKGATALRNSAPDHFRGDVAAQRAQNRGSAVHQLQTHALPGLLDQRPGNHEDPLLGVVGPVRAGVILERMNSARSYGADRPPVQVPEVDHQVRRHVPAGSVDVFRLEYPGPHRLALMIGDGGQLPGQLVPQALVLCRVDDTFRFAAADVHEDSAVVAAFAPGDGARPVHGIDGEGGGTGGRRLQREIALLDQPLVDADAAHHGLGSGVRHDDDGRVSVDLGEDATQLRVDQPVVVEHGRLVWVTRFVGAVALVEVLPEAVVHAVDADLHHHREVPGLGLEQVTEELEAPHRHFPGAGEDAVLFVAAEVFDVHLVVADYGRYLSLQLGRVGVGAVRAGREEAADAATVDRRRWVGRRHRQHDDGPVLARKDVPDRRLLHEGGVGQSEPIIGVVFAVPEAVDAQLTGGAAGHGAGPGGD